MKRIGWQLLCQRVKQDEDIFTQPLLLNVVFYMPIPTSWSKIKQESHVGKPCATKPDLSNLLKLIEDSANGVLYDDDARICSTSMRKIYDYNPRTEFELIVL
jgi:Holliday junction resolvase RusA-like endonuclease